MGLQSVMEAGVKDYASMEWRYSKGRRGRTDRRKRIRSGRGIAENKN